MYTYQTNQFQMIFLLLLDPINLTSCFYVYLWGFETLLTDSFGFRGNFFKVLELKHIFLTKQKKKKKFGLKKTSQTVIRYITMLYTCDILFYYDTKKKEPTYRFKEYLHHTAPLLLQTEAFLLRLFGETTTRENVIMYMSRSYLHEN